MGSIFDNKVFLVTVTSWALAQLIKVFRGVIRERKFNFKWLIGTGGMPSSHAAGATALATACGMHSGFQSIEFALAAVFALVTMFDAQGVRRSAGQQAVILNQIIDDMYWRQKFEAERLKELIGHTPIQVIVGGALGMLFSSFFYSIW